MYALINQMIDK